MSDRLLHLNVLLVVASGFIVGAGVVIGEWLLLTAGVACLASSWLTLANSLTIVRMTERRSGFDRP